MRKNTHIALVVILSVILIGLLAVAVMLSQGSGQWKLLRDETPDRSAVIPESTGLLEVVGESTPVEEADFAQEETQPETTEQPRKENGEEGEETKPGKPTEKETAPTSTKPSEEPTQPTQPDEVEETLPVEDSYTRGKTEMPDDEF